MHFTTAEVRCQLRMPHTPYRKASGSEMEREALRSAGARHRHRHMGITRKAFGVMQLVVDADIAVVLTTTTSWVQHMAHRQSWVRSFPRVSTYVGSIRLLARRLSNDFRQEMHNALFQRLYTSIAHIVPATSGIAQHRLLSTFFT